MSYIQNGLKFEHLIWWVHCLDAINISPFASSPFTNNYFFNFPPFINSILFRWEDISSLNPGKRDFEPGEERTRKKESLENEKEKKVTIHVYK